MSAVSAGGHRFEPQPHCSKSEKSVKMVPVNEWRAALAYNVS